MEKVTHLARLPHRIREGMPIAIYCDNDREAIESNDYIVGDPAKVTCVSCIKAMEKTLSMLRVWDEKRSTTPGTIAAPGDST